MIRRSKKARERARMNAELLKLVKQIVLLRDGAECSYCTAKMNLEAAHVKSQGKYARLKYCPYNVIILCVAHHIFGWHREPHEYLDWFEKKWPGRLDKLSVMAATAPKVDLTMTRIALEAELKELEATR